MAGNFTLPTVLANLTAGNQALSLVDGDFNACYNPLVSLNTFSNYYTDTGAANAYAITVSAPQTVTQTAGLRLQILITNENTGASTLQVNALAVKNIKNLNGSALGAGQIPANGVIDVIYDGTQYLLLTASPAVYATGAWSPVLTFATPGDLAVTYGVQDANYTKVGRLVTSSYSIITSAFTYTTASGNCQITGLPFTSRTTTGDSYWGAINWGGITKANYTNVLANIASNDTKITLFISGSGQATTNVATGDMGSGASVVLRGTITYEATS